MIDYITFGGTPGDIAYAIFIKDTSANKQSIKKAYIDPLERIGISPKRMVVVSVPSEKGKYPAKSTRVMLDKLAQGLATLKVTHLLVANGDLYKYIMGVVKTSNCFGEINKGKLAGYESITTVLSIDYSALLYNDSLRFKLDNSLDVFYHACTNVLNIKKDIIHTKDIPTTPLQIKDALTYLSHEPVLTCDIETESLRFEKARIITIAFAMSSHDGVVFSVDTDAEDIIKYHLYRFFRDYKGTLIFHNALYECKVLIYQLFMLHDLDMKGLREGLIAFSTNVEDSMLVTYLATNSTQEAPLGLKENSYEFAGNYGLEFTEDKAIHKYPREEVLEYNLKDALCTWYVYDKYYRGMCDDKQEEVYFNTFIASIIPNTFMMLVGMCMDMKKVAALDIKLDAILLYINNEIQKYAFIKETLAILKEARRVKDNADRVGKAKRPDKIKIKTLDDIADEPFNPNSDKQKQTLLYDVLDLTVINTTDSGAPSCDDKTLKALKNHTDNLDHIVIIDMLQDYAAASTVSSTFVKPFIKYAFIRADGSAWLNGNKKLGGTQSGRGSSNSPNMENIPNHSKYGDLIKECFIAPDNYLFGGADFSSLEDRINAILTQDPNKVKVYTDGYDGHCLRAHSYFGNEMPDIVDTVESINSIETLYPDLRQKSKVPTFALTYLGTWHTLVNNLGLTKKMAHQIEDNYHILYKVSDKWTEKQLQFAADNGYVECAFGLRLRTPLLGRTLRTKTANLYIAEKEGRSAANAITQSWGLLINRTAIEIVNKILYSDWLFDKIYPVNTIHDSIFFLFLDDPEVIQWLNNNLIKEMEWNDHPKIKSSDVPMGSTLSMGKNWLEQSKIPNNASIEQINEIRAKIV